MDAIGKDIGFIGVRRHQRIARAGQRRRHRTGDTRDVGVAVGRGTHDQLVEEAIRVKVQRVDVRSSERTGKGPVEKLEARGPARLHGEGNNPRRARRLNASDLIGQLGRGGGKDRIVAAPRRLKREIVVAAALNVDEVARTEGAARGKVIIDLRGNGDRQRIRSADACAADRVISSPLPVERRQRQTQSSCQDFGRYWIGIGSEASRLARQTRVQRQIVAAICKAITEDDHPVV